MVFPEEFHRFIAPGAERLVVLAGMLAARGLGYSVIRTGDARHLVLRLGQESPRLILAAHYDRVEGSPGVLDNSSACWQLVDFAARQAGLGRPAPILVVFTDGEEAPGHGGAGDQGSLGLARVLGEAFAEGRVGGVEPATAPPPVLVLDVTGRGSTVLLSSTPRDHLAKKGLLASAQAQGHALLDRLVREAMARAGLPEPLARPLPWSDDLGLMLGGLGALTLSLLPPAELGLLDCGTLPPTWALLHSPGDCLEEAEAPAFALMASLLDAVAASVPTLVPQPQKTINSKPY